jgi:hypothetical protein
VWSIDCDGESIDCDGESIDCGRVLGLDDGGKFEVLKKGCRDMRIDEGGAYLGREKVLIDVDGRVLGMIWREYWGFLLGVGCFCLGEGVDCWGYWGDVGKKEGKESVYFARGELLRGARGLTKRLGKKSGPDFFWDYREPKVTTPAN